MRTHVYFDGTDLTTLADVSDIREPLLPRRLGTVEVPGRDGSLLTGASLAAKTITLTLAVKGSTLDARRSAARAIAALLNVDEPKQLSFSTDGGLYYLAVPHVEDASAIWRNAVTFDVTFELADPVAYGVLTTVSVPSGGSKSFTVGGTYPTMPTITASSAKNNTGINGWRLRLEDGSYVMVNIQTSTGNLICDCESRVLTVNGATKLLVPEADWLVLAPGAHTLTMTGTGAATVTYRERWL